MEHTKIAGRDRIRDRLISLPSKMIALHGNDNVTEFVLHELCHKECFNLKKAAYFIDNPDFNFFKGIAGYDAEQYFDEDPDRCWLDPDSFSNHMQQASFNQRVRRFSSDSPKYASLNPDDLVKTIAYEFSFVRPELHTWNLKNNNHGMIIFEPSDKSNCEIIKKDFLQGVHLLSFCPIF